MLPTRADKPILLFPPSLTVTQEGRTDQEASEKERGVSGLNPPKGHKAKHRVGFGTAAQLLAW